MPKISVIMPAYNAEQYIAEAMDSILGQTFGAFEFIILNDCSTDRTEEIILSYDDPRIVYRKNERNLGVAATLNRGLEIAQGEYIARMDADDISLPQRFEKQVTYMDAHPECGICGSNTVLFGTGHCDTLFTFAENDEDIRGDMLIASSFAHPSVMLRWSVLSEYKLYYDTAYEGAEDYQMWFSILDHSKGHNVQTPLLRYRLHTQQVTQKNREKQMAVLRRIHREQMENSGITLTPLRLDLFIEICLGKRNLASAEYSEFVLCAKQIITGYSGNGRVRWNLSSINMAIKKQSKIKSFVFFSWKEPLVEIYTCLIKFWRAK